MSLLNINLANCSSLNKILLYVVLLIIFFLPLSEKIIPPLIVIWVLLWLFDGNVKEKIISLIRSRIFFLLIFFYLLHVIGMIYTENISEGLFDLEVKFSLLLFPILILSDKENFQKNHRIIFFAFVLGNIVAALSCFIFNIYWSLRYNVDYFYYSNFTLFLHPSYASMYAIFSICIIIYFRFYKVKSESYKNFLQKSFSKKWFSVIFILVLLAYVFNLGSRTGIAAVIIVTGTIISYYFILYKRVILFFVFATVIFCGTIYTLNKFPRFAPVIEFLKTPLDSVNVSSRENVVVRYFIIKESLELIRGNFLFGIGTGDIKQELIKKYQEKKNTLAIEENLNPHNQFIETFATLGILGEVSLLMMIFIPFYSSTYGKNIFTISFILLIIINFLFESMLNTQAGVVFFAFFNSLLSNTKNN
ncbi:MAG: O-antigen ligase family protein [Bacteroidetes bacterium]|nr:O-antigen ligase family protein [Bacteroidota bacterium]